MKRTQALKRSAINIADLTKEEKMPKVHKKRKTKFPQIKKDIKDFLLSEEGKVSKKNIAKIGMSLTVLGLLLQPESAQAQHTSNLFAGNPGANSGHSSTHANHSNHGNHGDGGWC